MEGRLFVGGEILAFLIIRRGGFLQDTDGFKVGKISSMK